MDDLQIEPARQNHLEDIWGIITNSFQNPQSRYTAIGQRGYAMYLHDFLSNEGRGAKYMVVGLIQGQVAAFADITVRQGLPNFLTRIAVKTTFRGQGLATRLMTQIHKTYGRGKGWELDVFQTNVGATRMYESLGFKITATSRWLGRLLTQTTRTARINTTTPLSDDPNYLRYGFTNVDIRGRNVSIAGAAVRCRDLDLFWDDSFLTEVQEQYPKIDRAFIVLNDTDTRFASPADVFEIDRSYRMAGTF